ncbi:MAG: hypothetical protein HY321_08855 [Armatimonadetes bacterium]|nr:hypothetical protein [Armatimonadota bacterium]
MGELRSEYTDFGPAGGITEEHRRRLAQLHRAFAHPFVVEDAARLWGVDHAQAGRLLTYWASRGWLARVRRGLYLPVPLETRNPSERREDPWIVAATLFAPGYLGGWTACEHWGLTDQVFADLAVYTTRRVRHRDPVIQEVTYHVRVIRDARLFGLRQVWRGHTQVSVSDPARTLADILDDPSMGGGMKHVAEVAREYFESDHRDDAALREYAGRLGNRAICKRLGYLIETLDMDAPDLLEFCRQAISSGYSKLDPSVPTRGRLLRRWNLAVNVRIAGEGLSG